jgi:anti-anti-sigma regulatory factor
MFGTDTLRYRDTAKKVIESLPKESDSSMVIIDFAEIDFASSSFLQELLHDLGSRKVTFQNRNEEVEELMAIIQRKAALLC